MCFKWNVEISIGIRLWRSQHTKFKYQCHSGFRTARFSCKLNKNDGEDSERWGKGERAWEWDVKYTISKCTQNYFKSMQFVCVCVHLVWHHKCIQWLWLDIETYFSLTLLSPLILVKSDAEMYRQATKKKTILHWSQCVPKTGISTSDDATVVWVQMQCHIQSSCKI